MQVADARATLRPCMLGLHYSRTLSEREEALWLRGRNQFLRRSGCTETAPQPPALQALVAEPHLSPSPPSSLVSLLGILRGREGEAVERCPHGPTCLDRERDGQDLRGGDAVVVDQVRNARREHAGLAAPRPCHHPARSTHTMC